VLDPRVARRVRLLALDVDGVLTDNGVYIGAAGGGERVELKRFDIQDGLGLAPWRTGIRVAISGYRSEATSPPRPRAGSTTSSRTRAEGAASLLDHARPRLDEVAFVGDDLADVPVMQRRRLRRWPTPCPR
jgi:3-deoxy-D-manno-octulosonate 8-phosphate phosphatase (KDO 8-P phosphatase)